MLSFTLRKRRLGRVSAFPPWVLAWSVCVVVHSSIPDSFLVSHVAVGNGPSASCTVPLHFVGQECVFHAFGLGESHIRGIHARLFS